MSWEAGEVACKLIKFIQGTSTYASTYVLVALSIDRYDAITHPMNFSNCCTYLISTGSLSIFLMLSRTWLKFSIISFFCREACKTASFFRVVLQCNFLNSSFYTLPWRSHSGCQSMLDWTRRAVEVATIHGSRFSFTLFHSGYYNYTLLCDNC